MLDILFDFAFKTMVIKTHFAYFQVVAILNDLNLWTKNIYAY
jgi:hypothetical protein